jgi:hypothetical protein
MGRTTLNRIKYKTRRKIGRSFKEEVEKQGNAWAIHTEYR